MTMHSFHEDREGRGWSNRLWLDCPWNAIRDNPKLGFVYFEDFIGWDNDLWTVTNATSGTMAIGSGHGGIATVSAGAATDSQGVVSAQPGGTASQFITPSANTTIWLECLQKQTPQTASGYGATWFGLATQTKGLSTAGAPDGTDRIGFLTENSSTNSIQFNYLNAGATEYEADTTYDFTTAEWIKLGFKFQGLRSVTPYINGVALDTVVATSIKSLPDAIMNITLANVANGGTGTPATDYDWIRFACFDERTDIVTL